MISVCIPVGPYAWYKKYLAEALESVMQQTMLPHDIVLIDDMAGLTVDDLKPLIREPSNGAVSSVVECAESRFPIRVIHEGHEFARVWRAPWRLGIPGAPNAGIALGQTDLVFQFSCDDRLMPRCLEECWAEWQRRQDPLGYYWVSVEYSHGEKQRLPCGHALVPKALWRHTGGFPPESGVGGCDAAFISMLITQSKRAGTMYEVGKGVPLYWHRAHDQQYTRHQNAHPASIIDVRKVFGDRWQPVSANPWGRMS